MTDRHKKPSRERSQERRDKFPEKCREYERNYHRERYATDPEYRQRHCDAARWRRRLVKYGITRAQYEALLAGQDGRCGICEDQIGENLRVDHDHDTGKVRGLLCQNCNSGLGLFRENIRVMLNAIEYVTKHKGA